MKAFILAAGLGTRLNTLTRDKPKALVKINGTEMLALQIQRLKEQGFDEFIINIHHHGQMILDFLKKNKNFGVKINISDEREQLLDTGGALLKAKHMFSEQEAVLVHNVDVISGTNYRQLISYHKQQGALATLCIRERVTDRVLLFDRKMELKGWSNKKTEEFKWRSQPDTACAPYAFSGMYVISPQFINEIKLSGKFSIIDAWLSMTGHHIIRGFPDNSPYWFDLGTPEKIREAEMYLINKTS